MELWERYVRRLIPLPESSSDGFCRVRDLDFTEQSAEEENGGLIYETDLVLTREEMQGVLLLRMHRVGCLAEVFENGRKIGAHYGSFTDWDVRLPADGEQRRKLQLRLREDRESLSPFERAGIFGKITLICLPQVYLEDYAVKTIYGEGWQIQIKADAAFAGKTQEEDSVYIRANMTDREGKTAAVFKEQKITPEHPGTALTLEVPAGRPWSPEHPVLYELILQVIQNGKVLEEIRSCVGLRTIQVAGKQVLWNGSPLKLRGLCYREPLGDNKELIRKDFELFREAGVNYLRSLYYPFSEGVLKLCDEMGILAEQSMSAYQAGRGIRATQNLPDCRELYGEQFSELLKVSRCHVSVLLWNVGSESVWGANFRLCAQMAKALAPEQLWNFSYPMTIPQEDIQPDVWSVLYADWKQPLDVRYDHMEIGHANGSQNEIGYVAGQSCREEKPVLHEIYAHLPCYNRDEILRDYGIHEFWGESILRFQEKMEQTSGALGGSVMAAYDEDGSFSARLKDCKWGILDARHEPKPEYHHLKMAFTGGRRAEDVQESKKQRCRENGRESAALFELSEDSDTIHCVCRKTELEIDISRQTGLVCGVWKNKEKIIESGPYLHITKMIPGEWKPEAPRAEDHNGSVRILLSGSCDICRVQFLLTVTAQGILETEYTVTELYRPMPPRVKAQIGLDPGGLDEFGISWILPAEMDTLHWRRTGLWQTYPPNHPGRPAGTASRTDLREFESMKHNILSASVSGKHGGVLMILPEDSCSIRMKEEALPEYIADDRDDRIVYSGSWMRMRDASGNLGGTETLSRTAGDFMEFQFKGTGVRLYGPADHIGGMYRVTVDGRTVKDDGSCFPEPVDIAAASRGYEKRYGVCMADIRGLSDDSHILRLEVLGKRAPGGNDTWVSFDYLEVLRGEESRRVRMILNHDFNYTRLVRGCYMREPVRIESGRTYRVSMRLKGLEEAEK